MKRLPIITATAVALLAAPALADRAPTLEEREAIQAVLIAEGFTSWSEIEWDDDGYWEVDDAIARNGDEYELKLDAGLNIIDRDRD